MWWINTNAGTAWGWTQLWQMGMEAASWPFCLRGSCCHEPLTPTEDIPALLPCPAPAPQPAQGRTHFCLILSLVSFPCCLKFQGEHRCKVTAVFVLLLHFGSRRAFLLLLLLPPAPASVGTLWVSGHCSAQGQVAIPRSLCAAGSRQETLNFHGFSIHAPEWACVVEPYRKHLINIGSEQLLSTESRNIWNINQYGRSLKSLSTQFTILYK